jgi:cell division protein FtsI (penicillin-binding protein 3)
MQILVKEDVWLLGRVGPTRSVITTLCLVVAFAAIIARLTAFGFSAKTDHGMANTPLVGTSLHRPTIVDRKGEILATDIRAASLFADPQRVVDLDRTVEELEGVLPDLDGHVLRKRLGLGGRFAWVQRELSPRQQAAIHELGLPGLSYITEHHRVYPAGRTAAHVLGFVDIDNLGLAGAEKYIDQSPHMLMVSTGNRQAREPTVELSIDLGVQHALREELTGAMQRYRASAAAAMVMDVDTGEILGMSSLPDFDPNQRGQALDKARYNRLLAGVFELGSIFKLFTIAAGLDLGVTGISGGYDASQPLRVASFTINDFHAKGRWLSIPEIFIYSSNIGAAKLALDIGVDRHKKFLKKLGFLNRIDTELGETAKPIVPADWQKLTTMTVAYGHGLSVTPMHAVAAAASVVNGGFAVAPTFLKQPAGASLQRERILKASTSKHMRELLRLNVLKGSGRRAEAEGFRVGGKTGTAEKVVNGRYAKNQLLTSFLSVFPADAPKYVVLVMLDEPHGTEETKGKATAGLNAAPTTGRIIQRIAGLLGVTPKIESPRAFDELLYASY